MCKRNSPDKNILKSKHGMSKRNTPHKNDASTGCVRETPHIQLKPAQDV